MHKRKLFWIPILFLFVASLTVVGCRAAAPTATPVPPTPTKAPAVVPTIAPAPTVVPAPTVAPTATVAPLIKYELSKETQSLLVKYPQLEWFGDLKRPTTQPRYGGIFRRAGTSGSNMPHWDPRISSASALSGSSSCYGGLLRQVADKYGGRTTPIPSPDAAESWKRLDDLTWEFKLNPNVFWHDRPPVNGRRVTAEDLKWNIEQYRENSIYSGSLKIISEVTIKDPQTLVIKTSEPYAHLLAVLSGTGLQFTAPEMEKEPGGPKTWCVGFGPFAVKQYQPGTEWSAERHPKYHYKDPRTGQQLPYFDGVAAPGFSDPAAVFAGFITGKTSVLLNFGRGVGELDSALKACPTCSAIISPNTGFDWHIAMRLDKAPFNDARVRRALSMGIDRQAILDTVFKGGVGYVSTQIPQDALGWDNTPSLEQRGKYLQFNLTEAKRLLAEAGYPNGFKATMDMNATTSGAQLSEIETVQFQWRQNLNVDVAFNPLEYTAYYASYVQRKYNAMTLMGVVTPSTNWDSSSYSIMYSKSPTNFYFIDDPEVDRWATAQRATSDIVKQREAYKRLFDLDEENIYRLNLITAFTFHIVAPNAENVSPTLYTFVYSWGARNLDLGWFKN
ncbi:MAG: ABC transporter substrate-binding protein [Chloroflexi bacterium]|nr:ABC transporter substrate-binding protein [Chloroflexota bacterium]